MRTHVHIHTQALGDANYTHAASQEVAEKWFTLSSLLLNGGLLGGGAHLFSFADIPCRRGIANDGWECIRRLCVYVK